jgi:hypothetical protein
MPIVYGHSWMAVHTHLTAVKHPDFCRNSFASTLRRFVTEDTQATKAIDNGYSYVTIVNGASDRL